MEAVAVPPVACHSSIGSYIPAPTMEMIEVVYVHRAEYWR